MLYGLLIGAWIATIVISIKSNKKSYKKGYRKGRSIVDYVPSPKMSRPSELDVMFDMYTEYDSYNRKVH